MIKWARNRARLSQERLADKLKITPKKVQMWESGELEISVTNAKALAKISLVPFGVLFADTPPEENLPIADFRTHRLDNISKASPELLVTIDDTKLKQEWYRDFLISEDYQPLDYVGIFDIDSDPEFVAKEIKRILAVVDEEYYRSNDWKQAFSYLINHAEDAGITVIVNGTLKNNNHRSLNENEFRGFVLSDSYAPIVFINGKDAKAAQMFTLIHEIAHILIGKSGILDNAMSNNHSIPHERWCNQVSAEFLVPKNRFFSIWNRDESTDKNLNNLRIKLKVSRLVCIFRAYQLGFINVDEKDRLVSEEFARINALKKKQKNSGGGPDPHLVRKFKTGRNLALAVISEVNSNRMLYRDAFQLLGVKNADSLNEFSTRLGY